MKGRNRIGFRGDSRGPSVVFRFGLKPRNEGSPIVYRPIENEIGGIDPPTAVCLSWRMSGASIFPMILDDTDWESGQIEDSWIYVVNVDLSDANQDLIFLSSLGKMLGKNKEVKNESKSYFVDTHARHVIDHLNEQKARDGGLFRLFYAQEAAVKEIKPEDILFAVKVKRFLNMPNDEREIKTEEARAENTQPMTIEEVIRKIQSEYYVRKSKQLERDYRYSILEIITNQNINPAISPEVLSTTKKFLENEMSSKENETGFKIATAQSGYKRNELNVTTQYISVAEFMSTIEIEKLIKVCELFPEYTKQLIDYILNSDSESQRLIKNSDDIIFISNELPDLGDTLIHWVLADEARIEKLIEDLPQFSSLINTFPNQANELVQCVIDNPIQAKRLLPNAYSFRYLLINMGSKAFILANCLLNNDSEFRRLIPNEEDLQKFSGRIATKFPQLSKDIMIKWQKLNTQAVKKPNF